MKTKCGDAAESLPLVLIGASQAAGTPQCGFPKTIGDLIDCRIELLLFLVLALIKQ